MDSSNSASTTNAMNILQQFSQLLSLQHSLAATGKTTSTKMDPSMFGFPKLEKLQESSATQVSSPPMSPQRNESSDLLREISDLLSSHQNLKSQVSPLPSSTETSPFKMFNDFGMDFLPSPTTRQYKVAVNRESSKPLQDWMNANISHPYPKPHNVQQLSKQTGYSNKQIRNWFTNARRRYEIQCGTNPLPWIKKEAPNMCRGSVSSSPISTSEGSCETSLI
uniref:Homeobox domain-containing protein n=1 Tax=Panagrolaimus sp. ES5 TaxID=591445 RepID=A0AC34G3I3_9BILA